jgi:hypothetical protein
MLKTSVVIGFVLMPTWIQISSLMSIQIRIRHQNDADPHADITPRYTHSGKSEFILRLFTAMPVSPPVQRKSTL